MANTFLMRFVALLLCLSLTSCDASPQLSGDPEGVDRNARPQVVITKKQISYDGNLFVPRITETKVISNIVGHDLTVSNVIDDTFFEKTGNFIVSGPDYSPDKKTKRLVFWEFWVRQEIDYSRDFPCTAEEEDEHRVDTARLIKLAEETERDEGWSRRSQIQALREKPCIAPGWRPNTPFKGYLEVDGIPIGPRMSFSEIAARRKQLKLSPLEKDPLDPGGRIYRAMAPDGRWSWDQVWYFEWTDSKNPDDRLLQNISVE